MEKITLGKHNPDCHIQVGKNFYPAPHAYAGHVVRVRLSAKLIEVFTEDAISGNTHFLMKVATTARKDCP